MSPQFREYSLTVLVAVTRAITYSVLLCGTTAAGGWGLIQAGYDAGHAFYAITLMVGFAVMCGLATVPLAASAHVWRRMRLHSREPEVFERIGVRHLYRLRIQRTVETDEPIEQVRRRVIEELMKRGFVSGDGTSFEYGRMRTGSLRKVSFRLRSVANGTAVEVLRAPNRDAFHDNDDEVYLRAAADVIGVAQKAGAVDLADRQALR